MAQLKGPGAMTGVNLVVKTFDNNVTKDGKTQYLDVQVDARDSRGHGQTNLHLTSERVKDEKTGETRYNNGAPYSEAQFAAIKEAAGDNVTPILKDGEQIGAVYGVKANVMPAAKGNGLVVNTKSLEPSEFTVDGNTLNAQFESIAAAKETKAAEAPAVEAEAEVEQVAEVEPQVG